MTVPSVGARTYDDESGSASPRVPVRRRQSFFLRDGGGDCGEKNGLGLSPFRPFFLGLGLGFRVRVSIRFYKSNPLLLSCSDLLQELDLRLVNLVLRYHCHTLLDLYV